MTEELLRHSILRGAAEWIFDDLILSGFTSKRFTGAIDWPIRTLCGNPSYIPSLKAFFRRKNRKSVEFTCEEDLRDLVQRNQKNRKVLSLIGGVLLIPKPKSFAGVDALTIFPEGGDLTITCTVLWKITVGSSHPIEADAMLELINMLPAYARTAVVLAFITPLEEAGRLKPEQSFTGSPTSILKAQKALKAQVNMKVNLRKLQFMVDGTEANSTRRLRKLTRSDYEEFSVLPVTEGQDEMGGSDAKTSTALIDNYTEGLERLKQFEFRPAGLPNPGGSVPFKVHDSREFEDSKPSSSELEDYIVTDSETERERARRMKRTRTQARLLNAEVDK